MLASTTEIAKALNLCPGQMVEVCRAVVRDRTIASIEHRKATGGNIGGRPKSYTDEQRDAGIRLREQGCSLSEIAAAIGVSRSSVARMLSDTATLTPASPMHPTTTANGTLPADEPSALDLIRADLAAPVAPPPEPEPEQMVRAHGLIPVSLNERLKAMARSQGRTADVVIGQLLIKAAADVERWEAEQEAARLRERFGANWLEVLREVA